MGLKQRRNGTTYIGDGSLSSRSSRHSRTETMYRAIIFAGCIAVSSAFSPALVSARALRHKTSSTVSMQLEARSPVNIFENMDKEGQDVKTSAFLKESEVKHGRLAMLAAVGWPVAELVHPYIAEAMSLPNLLNEASQAPSLVTGGLEKIFEIPFGILFTLFAVGRAFDIETSALRPRNNFLSKDPKEMYPHDQGFDPLGFYAKATPEQRKTMAEKELNNGRLAMIAIALYPVIEFSSKQPLVSITGAE